MRPAETLAAAAFAAVLLASGTPARAAGAKTIDVAALHKLVGGLGLEDTGDGKDYVSLEHQGSHDYTVNILTLDDGATVLLYVPVVAVAQDKAGRIPLMPMLRFNNQGASWFAARTEGDDKMVRIDLQRAIPAALVNPQTLRAGIDALLAASDESLALWDEAKWGVEADKPADRLAMSNVRFVSEPPAGFGMYDARPTNVFAASEPLITYAELHGETWKPYGDLLRTAVAIDVEIRTSKGATVFSKTNMLKQTFTSHVRNSEINLTLTLNFGDSFPAGDYVVSYLLRDENSSATAAAEQPFVIAAKTAAK